MSDELQQQVAAHERRFLRPRRADLDELAAALGVRGSDAGEVVWARAIAAGRVPASFADDPDRGFHCSSRGVGAAPDTGQSALLFASDPDGMLDAEAHARKLVSRFAAWGGPAARRVVWRVAHNPIDDPRVEPPSLGLLAGVLERLRSTLGGGQRIYEPRHTHHRFQPIVEALMWSRRWSSELPNPFEPWLSLSLTGYLFHGVRRRRDGEPTIELAAPFPAPEWLDPRHGEVPRAVWSNRLTGLRLSCMRGDVGGLQRGLALRGAPGDDEPGQPRLIHFAAYGGPPVLEQLAAAGRIELDARDVDGRTALMLAAGLPASGPTGAHEAEVATPVSEYVGAAACTWLIAAGAEPEARDHQGWTALHWAVAHNRARCVEALLAAGLDVDATDHRGRTPAMLAVQWLTRTGENEMLGLLLRAGADADHRDAHGWTVLHVLAATSQSSRDRNLARRLVEAGARPSRDRAGRSPADIYAWRGSTAVDGGPLDARTAVAAGPGLTPPSFEARLVARLLDQRVPEPRDPAAAAPNEPGSPELDDWRVWADWLESRGDPRGELVACELAMIGVGGSKRRRMQAQLDALRQRLTPVTQLGLDCADALAPVRTTSIQLGWTHGFVTSARLSSVHAPPSRTERFMEEHVLEAATRLLELEPLLAELCLDVYRDSVWRELIAGLAALAPRTNLRRLMLESLPAELPELDALPRVFPRVRSLHLTGFAKLRGGHLRWPGLTHLRVRHGTASEWVQGNVALSFDVPQLTHLDLALSISSRTHADELSGTAATLAKLGDLAHLRLSPLAQDFAAALLPSPLIARLRTLELAGVRGSALDVVLAHAGTLRTLARVRICVTPTVASQRMRLIEQLREALPNLEFDGSGRKWPPFGAWR